MVVLLLAGCCCSPPPVPDDAAAPDALAECSPVPLPVSCDFDGLGVPCSVACSDSGDCTFSLAVTWTGPRYCCSRDPESWVDCRCEHGSASCVPARGAPAASYGSPRSWCECDDGGARDAS
jgi:hypothetical protein